MHPLVNKRGELEAILVQATVPPPHMVPLKLYARNVYNAV
jgi:hypothetical protein